MSDATPLIAIATVYGDHSQVTHAVEELTGVTPGHEKIFGLAGPNELVQILANIEGWKLILGTVLSIYGTGIVSEAGKDTWRTIAPRLRNAPMAIRAKFLRLVDALQAEKQAGQDVSIGLIEPTFDAYGRRDRIYLVNLEPEEIARHLYIFAHCAQQLTTWLAKAYALQTERGQVHVEMKISDEGTLTATLIACYGSPLREGVYRKVFDANGNVIEESVAE